MLINRKRSYRRGPTYRQTYVPHDQRQLNTQPTPIMDEKTAQYYLNQLKQMGYIQQDPPYIVTIKHKDSDGQITFDLKDDLSLGTGGTITSANMQVLDIYGKPYFNPLISNEDILNRVGVKLYPIMAKGGLGVYNADSSSQNVYFKDIDSSNAHNPGTVSVGSHSFWYASSSSSTTIFDRALVSKDDTDLFYLSYVPNMADNWPDVIYCPASLFYLVCEELTVLVYPA